MAVRILVNGAFIMANEYSHFRKRLNNLTTEGLDAMIEAQNKWWGIRDATDIRMFHDLNTRKGKVEGILAGDPVYAEGGVMDFLDKKLPAIEKKFSKR